ncbi:hypothetical protein CRUP_008370 [Coryphaenoides rupestris]|nr:hypothetical protein CRUP_008370 [Coryphaenoides rupestris]
MLIMLGLDTLFVGLETIMSSVSDMFPGQMRQPWRREDRPGRLLEESMCSSCWTTMAATERASSVSPSPSVSLLAGPSVSFIDFIVEYEPLTSNRGHRFPLWAYSLGWVLTLSSVLMMPLWAIVNLCRTQGSLCQRLSILCRPVEGATINAHQKTAALLDQVEMNSSPPLQ